MRIRCLPVYMTRTNDSPWSTSVRSTVCSALRTTACRPRKCFRKTEAGSLNLLPRIPDRGREPDLSGLPATYVESEDEAETLVIELADPLNGLHLELSYTIFAAGGGHCKKRAFYQPGTGERASSVCHESLPGSSGQRSDMIQFSGAWARERYPKTRRLEQGIQSVGSIRGNSSHNHILSSS